MNLNQLNYFLVLARVGSYSEAAFQLDIAQSTLSQSMLNLEREFGTPLFYAEKRVTYLTGFSRRGKENTSRCCSKQGKGSSISKWKYRKCHDWSFRIFWSEYCS